MYNKFGQFIDGKWQSSANKETYDVINPATEEIIGKASKASPADVDKALKSAEKGFEVWKKVKPWERSKIIRKIADEIRKKSEVFAKWMTLETGKTLAEGEAETSAAADIFEWNAEETKRIYGQSLQSRFDDTKIQIIYQPVGVVAALSPWNFPLILAARKVSAALAAGCSVICKPDVITPGTVMEMVDTIKDCGVIPGAVNLLSGDPAAITTQLLSSDIVKKVSITGSTRVGKIILKQAADKVQRVTMELSGHAPFIVFDDANIDKVTDVAMACKYRNNGQVCISPSRFYIHESKKEEFTKAFVAKTKKLKIGNGLDEGVQLGPLTTKKRLDEVEQLVEETKKEGAKVLCGGRRPAGFNKGYFYEPTIFDNVKDNFKIMTVEPFGPLSPITTFKSFDEVIKRANNHSAGLAGYVCTNSMDLAHKTSEALETGMVAVNTPFLSSAETPFGGIKQSGYGREGGSVGIKDYLNIKYTHLAITG
jgi:succinate-semialdehyde dehydrogenase/glutarate-semialdehyde dehydrogenase